MQKNIHDVVTN